MIQSADCRGNFESFAQMRVLTSNEFFVKEKLFKLISQALVRRLEILPRW